MMRLVIQQVPGTAANAAKAMDGEAPEEEKPMPEVPPPDFINCCKAVLLNFGNLNIDEERGDLSTQIKLIASEAEVVATRIYGNGMTAREQQVSSIGWFRVPFVYDCTNLTQVYCLARIVCGRNKLPQSLTLKHSRLKQSEEERLRHGRTPMEVMNSCQDLEPTER